MAEENKNVNITEMPYAAWLEQTLRDVSKMPVKSIGFIGVLEDGNVYTGYYNTSVADKLMIAGFNNQDAMIETLEVNGIIEYEEDDYGEEEE